LPEWFGPGGLGLINDVSQVETLAEIGLVLLRFTIGIGFSLETILSMDRRVLLAELFQVLLITGAVKHYGAFRGFQLRGR
jgi:CPA2 family monovalent cation:H+ antiporter-2